MTRRRWIADRVEGDSAILTGSHADHLIQVLRAKIGQQFDIASRGEVRRGTVSSIRPGRVEFSLGEIVAQAAPAAITLALAIFKFDRMEWAIEKSTELGVSEIIPVIAERSAPHLVRASGKRLERWQRLARQAAEQARRSGLPEIREPKSVDQLVAITSGTRVVLAETEDRVMVRDAVPSQASELALAVGPEGGWKEQEILRFRDAGWVPASLGQTILRAETAAVAAVAIAASILGPSPAARPRL